MKKTTKKSTSEKDVVVTTDRGNVQSGQETIFLQRSQGGSVRWVSRCDRDSVIVFSSNEGSPFKEKIFRLRAGGTARSGPLARGKKRGTLSVYKYSVMGAQGNNDPIIIVQE
jgi:hypothetical protein